MRSDDPIYLSAPDLSSGIGRECVTKRCRRSCVRLSRKFLFFSYPPRSLCLQSRWQRLILLGTLLIGNCKPRKQRKTRVFLCSLFCLLVVLSSLSPWPHTHCELRLKDHSPTPLKNQHTNGGKKPGLWNLTRTVHTLSSFVFCGSCVLLIPEALMDNND